MVGYAVRHGVRGGVTSYFKHGHDPQFDWFVHANVSSVNELLYRSQHTWRLQKYFVTTTFSLAQSKSDDPCKYRIHNW